MPTALPRKLFSNKSNLHKKDNNMKKTYFEAPALEVVKMQTMPMMQAGSANGEPVNPGNDNLEAGSRGFSGFGLEDDTEEE